MISKSGACYLPQGAPATLLPYSGPAGVNLMTVSASRARQERSKHTGRIHEGVLPGVLPQTQWDRRAPLIVHACSSTTYPISHYTIYKDIAYPYWTQNPAKYRFSLAYQRCGPCPAAYQ